ncbi:Uncharacterised protein [Acinetobacter baumannii]|nr:hypothetical protein J602_1531 [Acinetobacter baumannii 1417041]SSU52232.1 Uncharacterised protein [Acinetobacter baumannii]
MKIFYSNNFLKKNIRVYKKTPFKPLNLVRIEIYLKPINDGI